MGITIELNVACFVASFVGNFFLQVPKLDSNFQVKQNKKNTLSLLGPLPMIALNFCQVRNLD